MAVLKNAVISDTLSEARIVYLDRTVAKWWNGRRSDEDTPALCGWFWVRKGAEAGPFRTRSAAIRDAYYQFILHRAMPLSGHVALNGIKPPKRVPRVAAE